VHGPVVSPTITAPDEAEPCAYCRSRIFDHDPVCIRDCTENCGSPTYLCNYACLSVHIDENDRTTGDACR
jgi:hypothetical protein